MTDILVAYATDAPIDAERWQAVLAAIDNGATALTITTFAANWRPVQHFPDIHVGERVFLVVDRITRGWVPLTAPCERQKGEWEHVHLTVDPSRFQPCQLEWVWKAHFRRSWRYVQFTDACLSEFPNWREASGLPVQRWSGELNLAAVPV